MHPSYHPASSGIAKGIAAYGKARLALFFAGFSTVSLIYCVQPLLPEFAREFGVVPASSALALSLTTGALAFAIFAAGAVSQALPRRGLMFASMFIAAILNLTAALAPAWSVLLVARLLEGIALGGVPAVAMAYLAEEMRPADLGKAMALYVAGTAFGGTVGRVGVGLLAELGSWRSAMTMLSVVDLAASIGFALLLPASRAFLPVRNFDPRHHAREWVSHLSESGQIRLFGVAFLIMSVFVTLFNYATFRLLTAPWALSQTGVSLLFLSYLAGVLASPLAGHVAGRFGRRWPLTGAITIMLIGTLLTLSSALAVIVFGIVLVTCGFFGSHSIASAWVGRLAKSAKGHASSLYLLFYYLGSSITGSAGGWFWQHRGWGGVVALTGTLAAAGAALAATMREPEQERSITPARP